MAEKGAFETLAQRRNLSGAARLRRLLIPEFDCIVDFRSGPQWAYSVEKLENLIALLFR
jgi:hypothetical protein